MDKAVLDEIPLGMSPVHPPAARPGVSTIMPVIVIILISSLLFKDLIFADPILNFDDHTIIDPLTHPLSPFTYWESVKRGNIPDIQPVRDLSLILDLKLKSVLPFWSFHLTSFLIGAGILIGLFFGLKKIAKNPAAPVVIVALFSVHPLFINSVSWITARKHLLSTLFILCASQLLLSEERSEHSSAWIKIFFIPVFYALAVFSHPIGSLWAVVAIFWLWTNHAQPLQKKVRACLSFALCGIMVACLWINHWYYSGPYLKFSGVPKLSQSGSINLADSLLALGRYTFNVQLPFRTSATYYPGSIYNLMGLLILLPMVYASSKLLPRRLSLFGWTFFFLPLPLVLGTQQNVFVSDPYALLPAIGVSALWVGVLDLVLEKWGNRNTLPFAAPIVLLYATLFFISSQRTKFWSSDAELWASANKIEPTPYTLAQEAQLSLDRGDAAQAFEGLLRMKDWDPNHPLLLPLISKAVYQLQEWRPEQKLKFLSTLAQDDPWVAYYSAAIHGQSGEFKDAYHLLKPHLTQARIYRMDFEVITAESQWFCIQSHQTECSKILPAAKAAASNRATPWRDEIYLKRARALGISN